MELLLFIDFQKIFEPDSIWPVPNIHLALDKALLSKQYLKCKTITTSFIPPSSIEGIWIDYFKKYNAPIERNNPLYELMDSVPKNNVIKVPKFGKWTSILETLDELPKIIYITGVSTECCVLSIVLSAIDSGIKIYVIEDACAASTKEDHDLAIDLMRKMGPNVSVINSFSLREF